MGQEVRVFIWGASRPDYDGDDDILDLFAEDPEIEALCAKREKRGRGGFRGQCGIVPEQTEDGIIGFVVLAPEHCISEVGGNPFPENAAKAETMLNYDREHEETAWRRFADWCKAKGYDLEEPSLWFCAMEVA